jgi:hypothetical protein
MHVMSHPYVAGPTGRDGRYRIDGVPPGRWTVVCWHEGLRERAHFADDGKFAHVVRSPAVEVQTTVVVEAGATVTQDFTLPVPKTPRR